MIDVDARAGLDMLRRLVDSVDNPRPLLDALAGDVRDYVGDMFATGGRGAWPKLNAATVRLKGHGRVLIDDGGLAASLTGARQVGDVVGRVVVADVLQRGGDGFDQVVLLDGAHGDPL